MNFSIRQYTFFSILLIASLAAVFSYKTYHNFKQTQAEIELSKQRDAHEELAHALKITLENIRQSGRYLSQWQEVRQQLNNPEIFAYWYSVRFKKHAFDLQKFTKDMMIYNANGTALSKLDSVNLDYMIFVGNIKKITYLIENNSQLIYIIPIHSNGKNEKIIGFLSARLDFLPLLKSLGHFRYIDPDSLKLSTKNSATFLTSLSPELFNYNLIQSESLLKLQNTLKESITELILFIAIPSLILLLFIIYLIGNPIRIITDYINDLRESRSSGEPAYQRKLQINEINEIYHSISQYHKELSEKEENLASTLNSIGDAVITTDADFRIIRMNPVAERLTGWPFKTSQGKPLNSVFNIINPDTQQPISIDLKAIANQRYARQSLNDIQLISRNGSKINIAESATPVITPAGDSIGIVVVFTDITEQKIKDEQLQQSQKMDALGKLTGGIAHDFNNMIGIILGYAELLLFKLDKTSTEHNHIKQIHEAAERARKLTSKLLGFSRKRTHQLSVCNINELILKEQHMLSKTLTARIALVFALDDNIWPVETDPGDFQDALLNICINAMHAMPDGGKLLIESRNIHLHELDQLHGNLTPGDYVLISITDTGIGMDKATRLKIFDPFFTTKGDKGTGLGMSQVYGFVTQSGGTIHIYSEQGHGTKISIYLPRSISTSTQEVQQNNERLTTNNGTETILVVDDEPALANLCSNILQQAGYKTLQASSASVALDVLKNQTVDLVLSDVIMPEIDGFKLARIIRDEYPSLKIQLMSGFSGSISQTDTELEYSILSKPFSADELLNKIRQALDS